MMRELGFYMGADLNGAVDNLWFALLFKRANWLTKALEKNEAEVFRGLRTFEKAMTGHPGFAVDELLFIVRATLEIALFGHDHRGSGRGLWPVRRAISMLCSRSVTRSERWGWKDPNSHILIDYLSEHFDDLKYILVVRHGLDMAYSSNQAQLYNWGPRRFGVRIPDTPRFLPKASLDYWIKANETAITLGSRLLGDRFLVIRFEDLCQAPRGVAENLLRFLEIDDGQADLSGLARLVRPPSSIGRYEHEDISIFDEKQLQAVRRLGYAVQPVSFED